MNGDLNRQTYDAIPRALDTYKIIGISTPASGALKIDMLLNHGEARRQAIVVLDAFRCSSTLLASFSAGAWGAVIKEKGVDRGVPIDVAEALAARNGLTLQLGGELHGKPVPGGIIANSPLEACLTAELEGCLLHFQSTNFARIFIDLVEFAARCRAETDLYVISLANAVGTATALNRMGYDRVIVASGGFYEGVALEDVVAGGGFIDALGWDEAQIDDEAKTMVAAHRCYAGDPGIFHTSWTAKVLTKIGRGADIGDIVEGGRIPPEHQARMSALVLCVRYLDETPILRPLTEE